MQLGAICVLFFVCAAYGGIANPAGGSGGGGGVVAAAVRVGMMLATPGTVQRGVLTQGATYCCNVLPLLFFCCCRRLLEHGAKDSSELQLLAAPMSDEELLQVT